MVYEGTVLLVIRNDRLADFTVRTVQRRMHTYGCTACTYVRTYWEPTTLPVGSFHSAMFFVAPPLVRFVLMSAEGREVQQ